MLPSDRLDGLTRSHVETASAAPRRAWQVAIAAILAYAGWLAFWYWDTVASMVSIWYRSETFAHGFTILPISLWLVWQKRRELETQAPAPAVSVLPVLAILLAGVVWVLGDLGDVLAARHFAWVTVLIAGIWMLLGNDVARRLAFPLAFLYLAVPVGEFLVPTLIDWTADFTVAALRASGVPVLRDGTTFQVPTGAWSIVEACSGVRYLIASFTVGVLYAYLTYRTWPRRVGFVVASLLVPIVANWMRAYGIVMIGHLSNNRLAVGIDHIIYGWIFFGVVMLLLFWAGTFFREREPHGVAPAPATAPTRLAGAPMPAYAVFAAVLVASDVAPTAVRVFEAADIDRQVDAAAPALGVWVPSAERLLDWTPQFLPPRTAIASTYARGDDRAGLYVAVYYDQTQDSKLVSSANQLLHTDNRSGYLVSTRSRALDLGTQSLPVSESVLRIRGNRVVARSWFWIDGLVTASPMRAKLAQVQEKLRGRGDAGAIVVVYAVVPAESTAATAALDDLTRQAAAAMPGVLAQRLHARDAP
jgi:exosortase A